MVSARPPSVLPDEWLTDEISATDNIISTLFCFLSPSLQLYSTVYFILTHLATSTINLKNMLCSLHALPHRYAFSPHAYINARFHLIILALVWLKYLMFFINQIVLVFFSSQCKLRIKVAKYHISTLIINL